MGAKNFKSVIACIKSKETAFIVIAQNYQKRIQSFFYRSTVSEDTLYERNINNKINGFLLYNENTKTSILRK